MESLKDRLKQILIQNNYIESDDLEKALQEQKETGEELSKILIRLKLIDEDTLTHALSESLSLPLINISRINIIPNVLKIISKEVATKYKIMPISLMGENLTLAMADPLNIFIVDDVKALTGYTINPIISRKKDILDAIQKYYHEDDAKEGAEESTVEIFDDLLKDIKDAGELEVLEEKSKKVNSGDIEELTDEAPIIRLTDTIIQQSVLAKASDVFIEPMETTVRVRYRIDGIIREIDSLNKVLLFPLVSRIKVISNLDISEHRLPQDGRFKTIIAGNKAVDFRVSVLPTAFGEKIVLRVLDQDGSALDIEKLGFEPESLKRLKECSRKPHGMILSCGPTGSGKTTTLYSILKFVDSPEKNIVTVEDPVEYQMPTLNQVNVKPTMGLTFALSLRSILRQDPDIIMIGEIRDSETLDIAVKAALTGHLVLSSLHTTTAAGSVIRMMNMGIEPFLICSSVLAIVAQRLLRRVCNFCQETYELDSAIAIKVGFPQITSEKKIELSRGKGCKRCFKTGYRGRVGITEILILSPKIREAILSRVGEYEIKKAGRNEGMITMREDGLKKALEGLTSLEEVLRVTAPDNVMEE